MARRRTQIDTVGVRELRQNLSRYLERVRAGELLDVTARGQVVARLVPAGDSVDPYAELAARHGVSPPRERLADVAARLPPRTSPAGTTDAYLEKTRAPRTG